MNADGLLAQVTLVQAAVKFVGGESEAEPGKEVGWTLESRTRPLHRSGTSSFYCTSHAMHAVHVVLASPHRDHLLDDPDQPGRSKKADPDFDPAKPLERRPWGPPLAALTCRRTPSALD